jgi:hypothetical protein
MAIHFSLIPRRILNSACLILATSITIIGQNQFPVNASVTKQLSTNQITSSNSKLIAQTQTTYNDKRFRFKFNYSRQDFVINEATNPLLRSNAILAVINVWTKQHALKVSQGAYQGGAEYPGNVKITVYKNTQRLSLKNWIQQSQQVVDPQQLKYTKVAGQNAIQFQSTGLYETKKVALVNPRNSNIIVISLDQTSSKNDDAKYQKAFSQVISSFSFS